MHRELGTAPFTQATIKEQAMCFNGVSQQLYEVSFCHFILSTPALLTMYVIAIMLVASHTLNLCFGVMNPVYKLPLWLPSFLKTVNWECLLPLMEVESEMRPTIYLYQRHISSVVKTSIKLKQGYCVGNTVRFQLSLSDMQWQNLIFAADINSRHNLFLPPFSSNYPGVVMLAYRVLFNSFC